MTESKTIQLNGGEAHYFEEGAGEPLILLHGVPGDARVWRYNLDVLAVNFRVLALDLPAGGAAPAPTDSKALWRGWRGTSLISWRRWG